MQGFQDRLWTLSRVFPESAERRVGGIEGMDAMSQAINDENRVTEVTGADGPRIAAKHFAALGNAHRTPVDPVLCGLPGIDPTDAGKKCRAFTRGRANVEKSREAGNRAEPFSGRPTG